MHCIYNINSRTDVLKMVTMFLLPHAHKPVLLSAHPLYPTPKKTMISNAVILFSFTAYESLNKPSFSCFRTLHKGTHGDCVFPACFDAPCRVERAARPSLTALENSTAHVDFIYSLYGTQAPGSPHPPPSFCSSRLRCDHSCARVLGVHTRTVSLRAQTLGCNVHLCSASRKFSQVAVPTRTATVAEESSCCYTVSHCWCFLTFCCLFGG